MPKPEKNVVDRLATIRNHPLRRKILQAAEEAHAQGRLVSPIGLRKQLKEPMGSVSYHITVLRDEGALKLLGEVPRRGASEHLYGVNEAFLAEIQDSVALDQIAELIEAKVQSYRSDAGRTPVAMRALADPLAKIIRTTGRPVEA